jgi:methionyl-tRNA synthetase
LQTATYGPKISDNPDEKNIILSLCNDKYQKNKKRLTQQEDILFSSFLDTFKDSITNTIPQDRKKLSSRGKLSMSTIMEGTEHVKTHFYPEITQRPQQQEK